MWLAFVRGGMRGATLASLAFIGPSFVIVVILGSLYVAFGGAHWVGSLFYGIAPAAISIIALSAYRLLPLTVGTDPLLWIAAIAVGLITYFTASEVALAFLAAGVAVILVRVGPAALGRWISSWQRKSLPALALVGSLFLASAADSALLVTLGVFFVKAGAFVFGSGLAIVPFLHQGVVVEHGWLNEQQFLDAVAVGLITPGPVVITAAFVGYLVAGLPGAAVAAFGVFLPVYVFVILPGRWILRYKDAVAVRAFVAGVSAAAAGAIVAVSVILGRQAIHDATTAVLCVLALTALLAIRRWKPPGLSRLGEPLVVMVAGLAGLLLRGV
jgi:chromate transporter